MKPTNQELFALWKKVCDGTDFTSDLSSSNATNPPAARGRLVAARLRTTQATHGFCKELVEHGEHLWIAFVDVDGIEPTNNAAEQATAAHAVIWRKLSFGTQSRSGNVNLSMAC